MFHFVTMKGLVMRKGNKIHADFQLLCQMAHYTTRYYLLLCCHCHWRIRGSSYGSIATLLQLKMFDSMNECQLTLFY